MKNYQNEGSNVQNVSPSNLNTSLQNYKIVDNVKNSCQNNISKQGLQGQFIQDPNNKQNLQKVQQDITMNNQQPHSPIIGKNPLNHTRRNFLKNQQQYLEQNNISNSYGNMSINKSPSNGKSTDQAIQNVHSIQQQVQQQNQQKQSINQLQNLMQIYTPLSNKTTKKRMAAPNYSSLNKRTYTESDEIPVAISSQQENILNTSVGNTYLKQINQNCIIQNSMSNQKNALNNSYNNVNNSQNIKNITNNNISYSITSKRGSTNTRKSFLQLSNQQVNNLASSSNQSYNLLLNNCGGQSVISNNNQSNSFNQQNSNHNKSSDKYVEKINDLPNIQTPSSQIEKKNFQISILQQQQQPNIQNAHKYQQQYNQQSTKQQTNFNRSSNNQISIHSQKQISTDSNNRASSLSNYANQINNQHESINSPIYTPYGQNVNHRSNILRMRTLNDRRNINTQNDDEEPIYSSIQNPNDLINSSSPQNDSNNKQFVTIQQSSIKNNSINNQQLNKYGEQSQQNSYLNNNYNQLQNITNNIQNKTNKKQRINYNLSPPSTSTPSQISTKKYLFQQNRPSQNYSSNARSIRESSQVTRASSPFQKSTTNKNKTKIKFQNNNFVRKSNNQPSTPSRQGSVLYTEGSIQNNLNTSINNQQSGDSKIKINQKQQVLNSSYGLTQYGSFNKNLQIQTIPDNLEEQVMNLQMGSRKNRNISVRNNPSYYYNKGEKLITIQNDCEDINIQQRNKNVQSSQGQHSNYLQTQYSQSPSKPEKRNVFPQSSKHSTNQQLFEKSVLHLKENQEMIQRQQLYRQKFIQQQIQKRNVNENYMNQVQCQQNSSNLQNNGIQIQTHKEQKQKNLNQIITRNSESPIESFENFQNNQENYLIDHKPSHNISKDISNIQYENIPIQIEKINQRNHKRQTSIGQDNSQEQEPQIPTRYHQDVLSSNKHAEQKEDRKTVINMEKKQEQQENISTSKNSNDQTNQEKQTSSKAKWDLSEEEWNNFGDRFPKTLIKKKLLGRGGFALVWLGEDKKTTENYAVKQIQSSNAHQTHIKEIWFGSYFFKNGVPKEKYQIYRGINNLSKMMMYDIKPIDTWIYYELCGESLGSSLYELKGENYRGEERVYRSFKKDLKQLKKLVFELAHALWLLSDQRIVHSDLKTENILVKTKDNEGFTEVEQVKLIDYGSAFTFGNLKHFSMATPEYMAPEILNFILYQNQLRHLPNLLEYLKNYQKTHVIDIWSLGCVLIEIVSGIPLWMSLKTIVKHKGQELIRNGLFAAKGRVFEKIIEKQIEVVKNIDTYIDDHNYSGIVMDDELRYLVKKMLILDPSKRISPKEICQYLHKSVLNTEFIDIQSIEEATTQGTKNTQSTVASAIKENKGQTDSLVFQNTNDKVKIELTSPYS